MSQSDKLREYALQAGYTVVGVAEDVGSGKSMDRPGLQKVMAAASAGEMDVLLVHSITRLGRKVGEGWGSQILTLARCLYVLSAAAALLCVPLCGAFALPAGKEFFVPIRQPMRFAQTVPRSISAVSIADSRCPSKAS